MWHYASSKIAEKQNFLALEMSGVREKENNILVTEVRKVEDKEREREKKQ